MRVSSIPVFTLTLRRESMMHFKTLTKTAIAVCLAAGLITPAAAEQKTSFKIAWTIYAGWMPWGYVADKGIIKKWADKYGITVDVVQLNDYVESQNQYTAGTFDGVLSTNMDAISIPAAGGVDTTTLIVGDYSNGNDKIILKGKTKLKDIKGQRVNLVEYSVSEYLLVRGLESVGMTEKDITVVNTSDADIVAASKSAEVTAITTWNPMAAEILQEPGTHSVFDSTKIPGEIMDICIINTQTLKDNPALGRALAGAWYEVMGIMTKDDPAGIAARTSMAAASGTDLAGYESQLDATYLFSDPKKAVKFVEDGDVKKYMNLVRNFLFEKGLLGEGAQSADAVGIELADGEVLGDKNNVKFRFTSEYMKMAAEGKL